jgi:hypothetical protein
MRSPPKKSKKSLAMPAGIVTNGVILRSLGGHMRKFNTRSPRRLTFRLLSILAGALMLMAVLTPTAKADIIAYFNFEDAANGAAPDFTSEADQGLGIATTITTNYNPADMTTVASAFTNNKWPGPPHADLDASAHAWVMSRTSPNNGAHFDIPLFSATGIFSNMSLSFAVSSAGNGFTTAIFQFSTNGGGSFTTFFTSPLIPPNAITIVSSAVPAAANNAPLLVLRVILTGGMSTGNNPESTIDNIRVEGTVVPEPATVAGGLLGVLGLCFHQRRRLRLLLPRLRKV